VGIFELRDLDVGRAPNQPRRIVRPVWLHLALLEQGELFAQEEVLGCECAARPKKQAKEMDEIAGDGVQRREVVGQLSENGAGHEGQFHMSTDVT
jgi:hypothetical protein